MSCRAPAPDGSPRSSADRTKASDSDRRPPEAPWVWRSAGTYTDRRLASPSFRRSPSTGRAGPACKLLLEPVQQEIFLVAQRIRGQHHGPCQVLRIAEITMSSTHDLAVPVGQ